MIVVCTNHVVSSYHCAFCLYFTLMRSISLFQLKMSGKKTCKNCTSTDIEVDQARGIAVCIKCGVVLEENCIVSEVQFEENAYGGASAIGQFLSNDNQGGTGFINSYRGGNGKASREITMKRAREKITTMGQQLK
jgi:transcription factor IIIB subunit 2